MGIGRFMKKISDFLKRLGRDPKTPLQKTETVLFQPTPKFLTATLGSRGDVEGEDSPLLIPWAIPAGLGICLLKRQWS
jgi:hypothetical protein